jgi:hypothetical protein
MEYLSHDQFLQPEAFLPKLFTITIEKGNFIQPSCSRLEKQSPNLERYELHLTFDKSPFPPPEEWKDTCDVHLPVWECREFVRKRSKELSKKERAMNDISPREWSECAVS